MKIEVQNFAPDSDCINITIGDNEAVISISRDEHGTTSVSITNNATGEPVKTYELGQESLVEDDSD